MTVANLMSSLDMKVAHSPANASMFQRMALNQQDEAAEVGAVMLSKLPVAKAAVPVTGERLASAREEALRAAGIDGLITALAERNKTGSGGASAKS